MSTVASTATGSRTRIIGIEQHADRDEEQHRKGVAQRQRLVGGALAELGFAQDHAGEERAQRERDVEQHRAPNATPSAIASTASRNNSREPVWAT